MQELLRKDYSKLPSEFNSINLAQNLMQTISATISPSAIKISGKVTQQMASFFGY